MLRSVIYGLVAALVLGSAPARAACYDVSKGEPSTLTGYLYVLSAPGTMAQLADVRVSKQWEQVYVLSLTQNICIAGDEFSSPDKHFSEVQLEGDDAIRTKMKALLNSTVRVTLTHPFGAETIHEHRPLAAGVTSIERAESQWPPAAFSAEAVTVRAFYGELEGGDAEAAALRIVPERRRGAFAPDAMKRFYGSLVEPLRLVSLTPEGRQTFLVRYKFKSQSGTCDGRASVVVTNRANERLISSIHALDGC
jgi:hypothetical protein